MASRSWSFHVLLELGAVWEANAPWLPATETACSSLMLHPMRRGSRARGGPGNLCAAQAVSTQSGCTLLVIWWCPCCGRSQPVCLLGRVAGWTGGLSAAQSSCDSEAQMNGLNSWSPLPLDKPASLLSVSFC